MLFASEIVHECSKHVYVCAQLFSNSFDTFLYFEIYNGSIYTQEIKRLSYRNTRYFHSAASERRKTNRNLKLKTEDGDVVEEEEAMREVATYYFSHPYISSRGTRMDELLSQVDSRVS